MAEPEEEVVKFKRLYEEQRTRVKELERQNSELKDTVQHLMATARLANKAMGSGGTSNVAGGGGESRGGPRGGRGRAGTTSGGGSGGGGGGNRGRNSGGTANHRGSQTGSSSAGNERHDGQTSMMPIGAAVGGAGGRAANLESEPAEPDVRSDIVALLREASMGKDAVKLEAAIKRAEEAGLHFEAKQGRRHLARIKG